MNDKLKALLKIYEEASKCTLCKKFNKKSSNNITGDGLINYFNEKKHLLEHTIYLD
jgi:hypothetical protein